MPFPCLIQLFYMCNRQTLCHDREWHRKSTSYLLSKIYFLKLYQTSLRIIGLGFLPAFLGFLMRCVLSIPSLLIAKSKSSFIDLIYSLSVQFHAIPSTYALNIALILPQLLMSSSFCANLEIFFVKLFMIFSLFCSYISNFLVIRSTSLISSGR